jgi:hypothetical protein
LISARLRALWGLLCLRQVLLRPVLRRSRAWRLFPPRSLSSIGLVRLRPIALLGERLSGPVARTTNPLRPLAVASLGVGATIFTAPVGARPCIPPGEFGLRPLPA